MNEQEKYQKLWEKRVKGFETSGLTMKAWCEANQVKTHQFFYVICFFLILFGFYIYNNCFY